MVQQKTGQTLSSYANDVLFGPLGIGVPFWEGDRVGQSFAMAGLHLTADDMVKLSALLLSRGMHRGQVVVPAAWIDDLWRGSRFLIEDSVGGRPSWQNLWGQTCYDAPDLHPATQLPATPPDMVSANGYGGQFIIVLRRSQLQIVTQRDMDLQQSGFVPQLGGPKFLATIRRLDEAFALE